MRVLLLSPYPDSVAETIRASGDEVRVTTDKIETPPKAEFLISFGYRHILKSAVFAPLGKRALNLHTSVLPWNKGAHPNYWSWVDNTPKGVTLHVLDAGIDTGPIVAQEIVPLDPLRTLAETYGDLQKAAELLFARHWPLLRTGRYESFPQTGIGSLHRVRDLPAGVDWKSGPPASIDPPARRNVHAR